MALVIIFCVTLLCIGRAGHCSLLLIHMHDSALAAIPSMANGLSGLVRFGLCHLITCNFPVVHLVGDFPELSQI
jgi:hypothetical protein